MKKLIHFLDRIGTALLIPIDAFWVAVAALTAATRRVFLRVGGKAEVPVSLRNLTKADLSHSLNLSRQAKADLSRRLVTPKSFEGGSHTEADLTPRTI